MVLVAYLTKKHNYPRGPRYGLKEIVRTIIDGFAGLMTIVIIILGVTTGIFTVTESAAIASLYAFILTFIVYREVKLKEIWGILGRSCRTLAMVLSIIAAANGFCWIMSYLRIPMMVTNILVSISDNPIMVLMLINLMLLVLGMLMDIAPLILIVTPILMPVRNIRGLSTHPKGSLKLSMCMFSVTLMRTRNVASTTSTALSLVRMATPGRNSSKTRNILEYMSSKAMLLFLLRKCSPRYLPRLSCKNSVPEEDSRPASLNTAIHNSHAAQCIQ